MKFSTGTNLKALKGLLDDEDTKRPLSSSIQSYTTHYIFISFDIVNSTKIKHQLFNQWPSVFTEFFNGIIEESRQATIAERLSPNEIKPWKVMGDEIVFKFKLTTIEQIPILISVVHELLDFSSSLVKSVVLEQVDKLHSYSTPYTIPDIKATMWHAEVSDDTSLIEKSTVCQIIEIPFAPAKFEFIGPDIDIGFRIAAHSQKGCIAIDLKLAYVLLANRESFENKLAIDLSSDLFLDDYVNLKGVWDDKKYPIILYIPKSSTQFHNLRELVKPLNPLEIMNLTKEFHLHKGLYSLLNNLKSLSKLHHEERRKKHEVTNPEIHCVAICFSQNLKYVYIGRRPEDKSSFPSKFDCGCAQLAANETVSTALNNAYKSRYGLELDIFGGKAAVPIATYEICNPSGCLTNGFIFSAIVTDSKMLTYLEKIKLSKLERAKNFVPKLKKNIIKARDLLSINKKQKNSKSQEKSRKE